MINRRRRLIIAGVLILAVLIIMSVALGISFPDNSNENELRIDVIPLRINENASFQIQKHDGHTRLRTNPESASIEFPPATQFIGLDLREKPAISISNLQAPQRKIKEAIQNAASTGKTQTVMYTGSAATEINSELYNTYEDTFIVYLGSKQAVYVQYTITST